MDKKDTDRLIALLGRTGSDFEGERAVAALKANQFLQKRNLTWADVIGNSSGSGNSFNDYNRGFQDGARSAQTNSEQKQKRQQKTYEQTDGAKMNESATYMKKLRWLEKFAWDLMSGWEQNFVSDVLARGRPLIYKQRVVVDGLIEKAAAFDLQFEV